MVSIFKKLKYIEKKIGKNRSNKEITYLKYIRQCLSMSTVGTVFSASY